MKLTKSQISALAHSFCTEKNKEYEKEEKRRKTTARAVWDKTPDGRLYAKLPEWMKGAIRDWSLNEQVGKAYKSVPMPHKISLNDVEQAIVLATIDAKGMEDITRFLDKKFNNK